MERESRYIFNLDFREIDLGGSDTTGWLGQRVGGQHGPGRRKAVCFMATCPHFKAELREKLFSSWHGAHDRWNLQTYLAFRMQPVAQKSEQLGSNLLRAVRETGEQGSLRGEVEARAGSTRRCQLALSQPLRKETGVLWVVQGSEPCFSRLLIF